MVLITYRQDKHFLLVQELRKQWEIGVQTRQAAEHHHMEIWRFASPSSTPAMPVSTSEFLLMMYHFGKQQFKI